MTVFVSYSGRDRGLLEPVLAALRRAHEQVLLDDELSGGEAWWWGILDQIRGCNVFVFALSKHSLASKPCQAELGYARDLGKPIVPVQLGPLDGMRVNPLAAMQVIDYCNPKLDTAIELITAVQLGRARLKPPPDPMPAEPPMPFAYLTRLAAQMSAPTLSAQEQSTLVHELKAGLDEDGEDESARRHIAQLAAMLRDRPDVTYRTVSQISSVLQPPPGAPGFGLGAPTPATAPPMVTPSAAPLPPGAPGFGFSAVGPPCGAPPPGGRPSTTRWLIAAVIAAVAVLVVVVLMMVL